MTSKHSILMLCLLFILVECKNELDSTDEQMCIDLCTKWKGVATLVDNQCECKIADSINKGTENVNRMKREAEERGFDLKSCDLSSDKRSTRCTLGSKRLHGKNYIDNVAKYFMDDGPITGSIFKAPPYAAKAKSSDCGEATSESVSSPQPQQIILNPPQPQQIVLNPPQPQQFVLNPSQPQQFVLSPPQPHQFVLSPSQPQQIVFTPQFHPQAMMVGSPSQPQLDSSSDNVGAPQIITQPKETMSSPGDNYQEISAQPSNPQILENTNGATIIHIIPGSNAPTIAAINPNNLPISPNLLGATNLPNSENLGPTILHILTQHLTQPMLGIPQAIKTVTESPGINDLVSAPGHFINTLMHRFGYDPSRTGDSMPKESSYTIKEPTNSKNDCPPSMNDGISPTVGSQNPASKDSNSQLIGAINPSVGTPQTAYIHPMPSYSFPMIHGPIISSLSPYPNFVSQPPGGYILASPMTMPYFGNINGDSSSATQQNPITNLQSPTKIEAAPIVGQPKVKEYHTVEVPVVKQKKICKKSSKEQAPSKVTRDVKATSKSFDETKSTETEEQIKIQSESKQRISKVHNVERTTPTSVIEKVMKSKVENLNTEIKAKKSVEKTKLKI